MKQVLKTEIIKLKDQPEVDQKLLTQFLKRLKNVDHDYRLNKRKIKIVNRQVIKFISGLTQN